MTTFGIIGGDERFSLLAEQIGGNCLTAMLSAPPRGAKDAPCDEVITKSDVIILPIPLTRDGSALNAPQFPQAVPLYPLLDKLNGKRVFAGAVSNELAARYPHITDYGKNEQFLQKNAVLTAEGTLAELIASSGSAIYGSNALIIGFGRIGSVLSRYLSSLGGAVTAAVRSEKAQKSAEQAGIRTCRTDSLDLSEYDYIINTAPAPIIGENELKTARQSALIFDLASAPYGVDLAACRALGIRARRLPALPSVYSPKAAAKVIYDTVVNSIC
ncbi:MAG: dipicolinate synthase subunit DpsA [Acutalibacteraceae bacterium]